MRYGDVERKLKKDGTLPGPGSYWEPTSHKFAERSVDNRLKNEPVAKFGRAKKGDVLEQTIARNYTVPAPGTYSPKTNFSNSVTLPRGAVTKFSKNKFDVITHRWNLKENEDKPGPGQYEIKGDF